MNLRQLAELRPTIPGYGELRAQTNKSWAISMLKGDIVGNSAVSSSGLSARVLCGENWGLASAPELTADSMRKVLDAAADNARYMHSRMQGRELTLSGTTARGHWDYHTQKPRASAQDKQDFLAALESYTVQKYPNLLSRHFVLTGFDQEKSIVTSDGAEGFMYIPRTHAYIILTADKDGTPIELRGPSIGGLGEYEDFFGDPAEIYPAIDALYEEVMKKREGIYPESGVRECILAPDLAGILAHEAVGHTVEADLVLQGSIAGPMLNKQVASELVNITDFAHTAFGETCPVPLYIDDEGIEGRDAKLIENGILTGYMHDRKSALHYGVAPQGNARAFAFSDEPLIRMRNTCILPGTSKLADMIASIEDGYLLKSPGNGQADMTSEFMFGVDMGYHIKNGKIGQAILGTTVSGVAFEMLKTVTAVSDDVEWVSSGFCGKKQRASVGMGGPAIQCKINIGGK